jgi:AmmeMemoRadiSam system protein A
MSHYHPAEVAEKMDKKTISHIEKLDAEGLLGELRRGNCELCGGIPVLVTLLLAKELSWKPADLRYAHSGDATGDRSKVVGYTSVAFYTQKDKEVEKVEQEAFLTGEEKKMLLTMVRQTLEEYLKTGKVPDFFKDKPVPEHLKMETGMFVTLHKNHMLRGCIGYITGREPLYKAVSDLAISSATRDPRFRPVKHEELKDIDIEISVMTPLKRITDPNEVVVGKHGVVVQKGFSSGVFLPQVATEQGWDRETFLTELCRGKAGLPGDAWKDKNTELYIFSADVFGEKE